MMYNGIQAQDFLGMSMTIGGGKTIIRDGRLKALLSKNLKEGSGCTIKIKLPLGWNKNILKEELEKKSKEATPLPQGLIQDTLPKHSETLEDTVNDRLTQLETGFDTLNAKLVEFTASTMGLAQTSPTDIYTTVKTFGEDLFILVRQLNALNKLAGLTSQKDDFISKTIEIMGKYGKIMVVVPQLQEYIKQEYIKQDGFKSSLEEQARVVLKAQLLGKMQDIWTAVMATTVDRVEVDAEGPYIAEQQRTYTPKQAKELQEISKYINIQTGNLKPEANTLVENYVEGITKSVEKTASQIAAAVAAGAAQAPAPMTAAEAPAAAAGAAQEPIEAAAKLRVEDATRAAEEAARRVQDAATAAEAAARRVKGVLADAVAQAAVKAAVKAAERRAQKAAAAQAPIAAACAAETSATAPEPKL